ncbi:MAG: hypothetical protein WA671_00465 [Candidatus Sulfotelmatobacter sp.]
MSVNDPFNFVVFRADPAKPQLWLTPFVPVASIRVSHSLYKN